jgi:hypothetical protein
VLHTTPTLGTATLDLDEHVHLANVVSASESVAPKVVARIRAFLMGTTPFR